MRFTRDLVSVWYLEPRTPWRVVLDTTLFDKVVSDLRHGGCLVEFVSENEEWYSFIKGFIHFHLGNVEFLCFSFIYQLVRIVLYSVKPYCHMMFCCYSNVLLYVCCYIINTLFQILVAVLLLQGLLFISNISYSFRFYKNHSLYNVLLVYTFWVTMYYILCDHVLYFGWPCIIFWVTMYYILGDHVLYAALWSFFRFQYGSKVTILFLAVDKCRFITPS